MKSSGLDSFGVCPLKSRFTVKLPRPILSRKRYTNETFFAGSIALMVFKPVGRNKKNYQGIITWAKLEPPGAVKIAN